MRHNVVRAKVLPIKGKHYATKVEVTHPYGDVFTISVAMGIGDPSDNELLDMGVDRSGWEANVEVSDVWGGMVPVQSLFCYDHYQSSFELSVAEKIASVLDGTVLGEY
jgi:hypothetical protein